MTAFPHASDFGSLVEILDDAATRWPADRHMYGLRLDSGMAMTWSAREMQQRSLHAAWRLRAAGLGEGDRLLTWSPSTPHLPAVYWGAMRAGLVTVPVDLRMKSDVVERIAAVADTRWLAVDDGYDAPDPAEVGLDHLDILKLADLTADPEADWPDDWEAQVRTWPQPDRDTLFEVHFTSGTTAAPKGVLLTHGNFLESMGMFSNLLDGRHLRAVSILPLSHLLEQVSTLFFGTMMGAEVVYVRSRNPRVIFEAMRELPATAVVMTPQVLELFWSGILREIKAQGRESLVDRARTTRAAPPVSPAPAAVPLAARTAWRCPGADRQRRCLPAAGTAGSLGGHRHRGHAGLWLDRVRLRHRQRRVVPPQGAGRPRAQGHRCEDRPGLGEILVKGATVSAGYWRDEENTRASRTADGWYRTGDTGHFTEHGDLKLSGRLRNVIVLPNGLNVFPEDIEAALADHGFEPGRRGRDEAGSHRGRGPAAGLGADPAGRPGGCQRPQARRRRVG